MDRGEGAAKMGPREYLLLSSCTKERPSKPSRYVKGLMVPGEYYFVCPRCDAEQRVPTHDAQTVCQCCRLHFFVFGDSLEIWGELSGSRGDL